MPQPAMLASVPFFVISEKLQRLTISLHEWLGLILLHQGERMV